MSSGRLSRDVYYIHLIITSDICTRLFVELFTYVTHRQDCNSVQWGKQQPTIAVDVTGYISQ